MSEAAACKLPPELLLHILDSLAPPSSTIALPPSNPATKTILAFTRLSRLTHPAAVRHLYSHCLFIDSESRLRLLLVSLESLLSPSRYAQSTLPYVDIKPLLTSLYLAPFPQHSIDSQPVAQWTFELFALMRSSLKRLVINIPFESMPPEFDHLNVIPKLDAAFSQLDNLNEFISCMPTTPPFLQLLLRSNHKLKTVALRGTYLEDLVPLLDLELLSSAERVVLAFPTFYMPSSRRSFFHRLSSCRARFVLLHEIDNLRSYWGDIERWMSMGMGASSATQDASSHNEPFERFCLPQGPKNCTQWLLERALDGRLWSAEAEPEPQLEPPLLDADAWPRFPDETKGLPYGSTDSGTVTGCGTLGTSIASCKSLLR